MMSVIYVCGLIFIGLCVLLFLVFLRLRQIDRREYDPWDQVEQSQ